jgi:hypothetical protein
MSHTRSIGLGLSLQALAFGCCDEGSCYGVEAGGVYEVTLKEELGRYGSDPGCGPDFDLQVGSALRFRVEKMGIRSDSSCCSTAGEGRLLEEKLGTTTLVSSYPRGGGVFAAEYQVRADDGCTGRMTLSVEGTIKERTFEAYRPGNPGVTMQRWFWPTTQFPSPQLIPACVPRFRGGCVDTWGVEVRRVQ